MADGLGCSWSRSGYDSSAIRQVIISQGWRPLRVIGGFCDELGVDFTAYDVKAKKKVKIQNPKLVKMKNGRFAVKGTSTSTGNTVFRILSKEEAAKMKK